jgi:uncharacterized membrane protein
VWPDIVMGFFVTDNVRYMRERLATSSAHVRFLFTMSSLMNQEIMGFVKLFVAFVTRESSDHLMVPFYVFLIIKEFNKIN